MKKKTHYRHITKALDAALFKLERVHVMQGLEDDLLTWAKDGELLFQKYKTLRDEAKN